MKGRSGWLARYVKQVDAEESTVRIYQEVFDGDGRLREVHEKFRQISVIGRSLARNYDHARDGGVPASRLSSAPHNARAAGRFDAEQPTRIGNIRAMSNAASRDAAPDECQRISDSGHQPRAQS